MKVLKTIYYHSIKYFSFLWLVKKKKGKENGFLYKALLGGASAVFTYYAHVLAHILAVIE